MIVKDRKGFLNKTFQKATFGKHDSSNEETVFTK